MRQNPFWEPPVSRIFNQLRPNWSLSRQRPGHRTTDYATVLLRLPEISTFTAVTRVQIPSGTPNLINNLDEQWRFFVGTKRNSRTARSVCPAVPQLHFPRFVDFFVGTKRHRLTPQL